MQITWNDLIPPDLNIVISVRARLFMVETQCMEKFMLYDGLGVTSVPNGDVLPSL